MRVESSLTGGRPQRAVVGEPSGFRRETGVSSEVSEPGSDRTVGQDPERNDPPEDYARMA